MGPRRAGQQGGIVRQDGPCAGAGGGRGLVGAQKQCGWVGLTVQPSCVVEISPQTVLIRTPPSPAAAGAGEAEVSGRGTEDSASCRLITASRSRRPPVGAWEPSPAAFWAGPRSTCFQLVGQQAQRCVAKAPGAE